MAPSCELPCRCPEKQFFSEVGLWGGPRAFRPGRVRVALLSLRVFRARGASESALVGTPSRMSAGLQVELDAPTAHVAVFVR